MKRQAAFLVRKRDGRLEWLRATKLSRSVFRALRGPHATVVESTEVLERLATEVTTAVLGALGPESRLVESGAALRRLSDRDGARLFVESATDTSDAEAREAALRSVEPLPTESLARAVEHALLCLGRPDAAERFATIRNQRMLRRSSQQQASGAEVDQAQDGRLRSASPSADDRVGGPSHAGADSAPSGRLDSGRSGGDDAPALSPRDLQNPTMSSEPRGGSACD
ncbi:MAG: hypothetical protein AAF196_10570 [Planctomycetota bacterium]